MALREFYLGSLGPFRFDDTDTYADGVLHTPLRVIGATLGNILSYGADGRLADSDTITATHYYLSDLNTAPASADATGTKGDIRITADYIYVCVATNTWKRAALLTW